MMITKTFSDDLLPKNCKLIEKYIRISGIIYHTNEVFKFIPNSQRQMSLQLDLEPNNSHDKNAIKVIGVIKKLFGIKKYLIGYVPAEISAHIYKNELQNRIGAALKKVSYDEDYEELVSPTINIIYTIFVSE